MKISIFGTGYVGLVTGTCLADVGHEILCVDVDEKKIAALANGMIPIYEPGLEALVKTNVDEGRLHFSSNLEEGVSFADIIFIAVGTPPDEDGSADLQHVLSVAKVVGTHMVTPKVVVNKSTVPVGTADLVKKTIQDVLTERSSNLTFDVASNPEFLKEGAAIEDFSKPDRIVVGTQNTETRKAMIELYAPYNRNHDRMIFMDERSAELTKYAANAMLATKISFMNELANIAEALGSDIELVRQGIGSDPRIGYQFIYPGCGYGGSCFPKDVKALISKAEKASCQPQILKAVELVNDNQKRTLFKHLNRYFAGNLRDKKIAIWGLSFKPNTDDMREAPSRVLMESLWSTGASVQAYDPEAMNECQRIYGARPDLTLMGTKEAALQNADALVICTEWKSFRAPDFNFIKQTLRSPVIVDGRNLYDPVRMKEKGLVYFAIGRGEQNRLVNNFN